MGDAAKDLRGTLRIFTIPVHFARRPHEFAFALRAMFWEVKWLCMSWPLVVIDANYFGYDLAAALNDNCVSDSNIFALYLFGVVKRGTANGNAGKRHWFEFCDWRY